MSVNSSYESAEYYSGLFDVPEQPEWEIHKAVFILNDWTNGQFDVFRKPDDVNLMYFYRLAGWVGVAEKYGYDRLDENGRFVAAELRERIPKAIQRIKGVKPSKVKSVAAAHSSVTGFVYLIQSPTTAYKIGRTKNPTNRMRTFGVLLPFEVEYVAVIKTDNMLTLEAELHQRFQEKRLNGEWFALDPEDVEFIKALAHG